MDGVWVKHSDMLLDANQLSGYYRTPAGAAAKLALRQRIKTVWPTARGQRLLGYGYCAPFLKGYAEAERVAGLLPAALAGGVTASALPKQPPLAVAAEDGLPFADAVFDRILVVHGLEVAEGPRALLRQLWRILAPEGRLLLVAPNRVSPWAIGESTPFGCGRPFRRGELEALLIDAMFEPLRWDRALFLPPPLFGGPYGVLWREKAARRLLCVCAGVHLVEARKRLYGIAPLRAAKERAALLVGA